MNLFELSAKISADTKDYEKAVNNATKVSKSLKDIMERSATQSETNKNKIKVLAGEYSSAKAKVAVLTEAFNKAAKEEGVTAEKTQKLAKELQEAEKESSALKGQLDELTKKSKNAGDGFSKLGSALGKVLKTAAKIGTAAVSAAATGITALTTAAVNNYAEYEQLVGGVETLFSKSESAADSFADSIKNDVEAIKEFQSANNLAVDGILGPQTMSAIESKFGEMQSVSKEGAETVIKNAANAYKTAGLSANKYMETVTSFSASLIQSLGGDTEEAAEYADMAIVDMADNANKMGSDLATLQTAYAGFAKGQFTLLDNLKLGYGGTKEEMQRLLDDAEKLSGVEYDISSFADITEAIHVMQEEMGIAGATALEAGTTIEGSVNSMKAAWSNLVTGLADGNADIDQLVDNLVTTIVGDGTESNLGVLGNIMPAVKTALKGAAKVVAQSAPIIAEELPKLMEEILPELASATANLIVALAEQIPSMAQTLVDAAYQIVDEIGNAFAERIPGLSIIFENLETVVISLTAAFATYKTVMAISSIIDALRKATEGQTIAQALLNAVMNANPFVLIATLIAGLVAAIITLWNTNEGFRNAIISAWEAIKGAAETIFSAVADFFTETIPNAFNSVIDWFGDVGGKFANIGKNIVDGLKNGISNAWGNLKEWFTGLFDDIIGIAKKILGIASPSKVFKKIGGFTAEGFGAGFEDEFAHVKDDMEDALNFDDASVGINASIRKMGAGAAGMAYGGNSFGNVYINIDGASYEDPQSLAVAVAQELQNMTDRRLAVYA